MVLKIKENKNKLSVFESEIGLSVMDNPLKVKLLSIGELKDKEINGKTEQVSTILLETKEDVIISRVCKNDKGEVINVLVEDLGISVPKKENVEIKAGNKFFIQFKLNKDHISKYNMEDGEIYFACGGKSNGKYQYTGKVSYLISYLFNILNEDVKIEEDTSFVLNLKEDIIKPLEAYNEDIEFTLRAQQSQYGQNIFYIWYV